MSVQAAMDFIGFVRRRGLNDTDPVFDPHTDELRTVVQVAQHFGFAFTEDDLRAAFRHDWQQRWRDISSAKQR